MNRLDFGMNVQASIEAPRVRAFERTIVEVEARIPSRRWRSWPRAATRCASWSHGPGGSAAAHGIAYDPDTGILSGGADPRRDGQAVAF